VAPLREVPVLVVLGSLLALILLPLAFGLTLAP
jgi:uncharacterized membrane protein